MKTNIKKIVNFFFFNQAIKQQNMYFYVPFSKKLKFLLEIFYDLGYIFGFIKFGFYFKIYLNILKIYKKIILLLKPSQQLFFSIKSLIKHNFEFSFYLFLNSNYKVNLLTFFLQKKIGGLLLCKFL